MEVYKGLWTKKEDLIKSECEEYDQYTIDGLTQEMYDMMQIIYASYEYESYSGEAWILFKLPDDDKYYEVRLTHCSCNGLLIEKDDIEETTIEAIAKRVDIASPWYNPWYNDCLTLLKIEEAKNGMA